MFFGEFCVVVLGLFLVSLDLSFCTFLVDFLFLFVHVSEFLYLFVDVFRGDGVDQYSCTVAGSRVSSGSLRPPRALQTVLRPPKLQIADWQHNFGVQTSGVL